MSDSPVVVECFGSRLPYGFTLQPFWRDDPPLWFASAEAQFLIHQVDAQEVKFAYVVSALQQDIAKELRELILTPPLTNPYDVIKQQLCSMTDILQNQSVQEEITDEKLGKITERLVPISQQDRLKDVVMHKLPVTMQQTLEPLAHELSSTELARMAAQIVTQQERYSTQLGEPSVSVQLSQLRETLHDLKLVVKRLSDYIEATRKLNDVNGVIKICWYHRRYGGKASKCTRTCVLSQVFASVPNPDNVE